MLTPSRPALDASVAREPRGNDGLPEPLTPDALKPAALTPEIWRALLHHREVHGEVPVYGPLLAASSFVLGRLAQSLDGFIASSTGESHWISGPEDIAHTHRLRALADAVVIGAATVRADDPQLTTRLVEGANPVRVILDPSACLAESYRVFDGTVDTLLVVASDAAIPGRSRGTPIIRVPRRHGALDLRALVAALAERGLRRLFIEGGGRTVSRFLEAGLLDRLHITVSPVLIGEGIRALSLPPVASLAQAPRFAWTAYPLGCDVLLDIGLHSS